MTLSIKYVPDHVARRLRERAARNQRSLQGELLAIVEDAVLDDRRSGTGDGAAGRGPSGRVIAAAAGRTRRRAFAAVVGGALCIAFAPIFVRLSEISPTATAFQRTLLALPLFAVWAWREGKHAERRPLDRNLVLGILLCGFFFAGRPRRLAPVHQVHVRGQRHPAGQRGAGDRDRGRLAALPGAHHRHLPRGHARGAWGARRCWCVAASSSAAPISSAISSASSPPSSTRGTSWPSKGCAVTCPRPGSWA